jgi:stringent starvation protein B
VVSEQKPKEKKEQVLESLEKGMTQLHLDARRPGVLVPDRFRNDHHLVLNISYRFDPPDLSVSDWGIRETLSFNGVRFIVGIPWSALFGVASLTTREFWLYPDDMPQELAEAATEKAQLPPRESEPPAPRAMLREVVLDEPRGAEEPATESPEPSQVPSPPKRGHLRVVK